MTAARFEPLVPDVGEDCARADARAVPGGGAVVEKLRTKAAILDGGVLTGKLAASAMLTARAGDGRGGTYRFPAPATPQDPWPVASADRNLIVSQSAGGSLESDAAPAARPQAEPCRRSPLQAGPRRPAPAGRGDADGREEEQRLGLVRARPALGACAAPCRPRGCTVRARCGGVPRASARADLKGCCGRRRGITHCELVRARTHSPFKQMPRE